MRKTITEYEKRKLAWSQDYECKICQNLLPPEWQIDHIVPLFLGGSNETTNLQVLCANCHAKKTCEERMQYNYSKPVHVWTKLRQLEEYKLKPVDA